MSIETSKPTRSLTTPTLDFMLLGGASLYVWIIMVGIGVFYRDQANTKLMYFAMMFFWLSLICNYPHFIISYRFGYGRGKKFIFKNWPALILMPVVLLLLYVVAYFFFNESVRSNTSVTWLNTIFESLGFNYRIGALPNLGIEIMSLSIRLMFVTSAWHYAKQVFGCIMVFSHYHNYPLTVFQKNLWKISLYSIGFYNFFWISNLMTQKSGAFGFFQDIPITNYSFPGYFEGGALAVVILLITAVLYFIVYKNYKNYKIRPTSFIMIPWIALHFWWIPFFSLYDFYFLAVPFFHSLQYLLFAYQLESPDRSVERINRLKIMVLKILVLCLVGYLAFEYIPQYLDSKFSTYRKFHVVFFFVAIPVFINIHHFFIDSVVWRFKDEEVRKKLLD